MYRRNDVVKKIDYSNVIKKSNDISMAKLNQGLSLNQMQLLAFAIFSTQQNGKTKFNKSDFQKKFGLEQYRTNYAYDDSQKLSLIQFSTQDLENEKFSFINVFSAIEYDRGEFIFEWNKRMLPHIIKLKEKYILTDLTITSQFVSGYSWILYDYLKAHYGYWQKTLSKEALIKLFAVENIKSYQATPNLKQRVLNRAIEEVNKFTEINVWYTEKKVGKTITHFTIHWSVGKPEAGATEEQMSLLRSIYNEVEEKMFDYISIKNTKNLEKMRANVIKIKEINKMVNNKLSSEKAKELISEAKTIYHELEYMLKNDKNIRDKSIYFNWLEDDE